MLNNRELVIKIEIIIHIKCALANGHLFFFDTSGFLTTLLPLKLTFYKRRVAVVTEMSMLWLICKSLVITTILNQSPLFLMFCTFLIIYPWAQKQKIIFVTATNVKKHY